MKHISLLKNATRSILPAVMKKASVFAIALIFPVFAVSAANLTDAEIAGIVVAANEVDIEAGRLVETKSTNEQVKAYAHRMVGEHTDVNESAKKLVTKLGVKPEETMISTGLRTEGKVNLAEFNLLNGNALDRSYIDEEIELHKKVIDTVDKQLLPSVKNQELKEMLVSVRPSLVSHLEHAQKIKESLAGSASR
jgi:putative membrane protein